ncbi:MAG TPA: type 1 glutamine amidotransferase domain-containing protein [Patescibacteria group bacterium]|nr:type 1 glutamine amidotransferase domain-containing protein [Patescibacteria group bacterium]
MTTQPPIPDDIITPSQAPDSVQYVLIITADKVEDLEFFYPYYRLVEENIRVDVATPNGGAFKGKNGYELKETLKLEGLNPDAYDLLLIPGGKAPEELRKNEAVVDFVRVFAATGKPIAAICHGPQLLATAGVIGGATLSGYPEIRGEIEAAGAAYAGKDALVDGQFITGRWPADLPAFTKAIMDQLKLKAGELVPVPKPEINSTDDVSPLANADYVAEHMKESFQSAS